MFLFSDSELERIKKKIDNFFIIENVLLIFSIITYLFLLSKESIYTFLFIGNSSNKSEFIQYDNEEQLSFGLAYSPFMEGLVELHDDLLLAMLLILIFVSWFLLQLIVRYKSFSNSRYFPASSVKIHDTPLEIVWTIIPAVILVFIAVPTFALLYAMDEEIIPLFTLRVIGHQWYWSYEYGNLLYNDSYINSEEDFANFAHTSFSCCENNIGGSSLFSISSNAHTLEEGDSDHFKYGYCQKLWQTNAESFLKSQNAAFLLSSTSEAYTGDFEFFLLTDYLTNNDSFEKPIRLVNAKKMFWVNENLPFRDRFTSDSFWQSGLFNPFLIILKNNMAGLNGTTKRLSTFMEYFTKDLLVDDAESFVEEIVTLQFDLQDRPSFKKPQVIFSNVPLFPGMLNVFDSMFHTINTEPDSLYTEFESYMIGSSDIDLTDYSSLRLLETDTFVFLPIQTHIRALVTSYDVLHAWCVPALGVKMDAVPGRLNEFNMYISAPGVYYGQCSELCGANHAFMPIKIEAVDSQLFKHYAIQQRNASCQFFDNEEENFFTISTSKGVSPKARKDLNLTGDTYLTRFNIVKIS